MLRRRKDREKDLERELRAHLDLEAEEQREHGLGSDDAKHAAQRALGNVSLTMERTREVWGWTALEQFWQDVRYGTRQIRRNPGFAAVVIGTLALGIGANTAIFSVVNGVLLRPLAFPEPDRLVRVWEARADAHRNVVNGVNFLDWNERNRTFAGMAAVDNGHVNVTGQGRPESVPSMAVSPQFFQVMGVPAFRGRTFTAAEGVPGRDNTAVISYGFWQSHFGGAPDVLQKKLMINGRPMEIIGIMPPGFALPNWRPDIWAPLAITRSKDWEGGRFLGVVGRLRPGVTLAQARDDVARVANELAHERPDEDKGWTAEVYPMLDDATQEVRLPLLVLLGAVGFVMLIACANVANLLLMRGTARSGEMGVRVALGAARRRIVQQLLSEGLVLAVGGWIAGMLVAYPALRTLLAIVPADSPLPRAETIHLDGTVLGFSGVLAVCTVFFFALVPAWQISRTEVQQALNRGSLRTGLSARRRFRYAFVVAEVALSLVLLAGAGLMLRSFYQLLSVNPGFATERVLTISVSMFDAQFEKDEKRSRYLDDLLTGIRATPGVESAGSIHFIPMKGQTSGSCFSRIGEQLIPSSSPDANFLIVSSDYFPTVGMRVVAGRDFGPHDQFGKPGVAVVNEAFAKKVFPGQGAVGQRINVCWTLSNPVQIVGVVNDARQTDLETAPKPTIFLDNAQAPMYFANLVIRTRSDPRSVMNAVVAAIHRVNSDQALSEPQTMKQLLSDSVATPRLELVLLATFATIAILLASLGVYGVVAYSVFQRTPEIGIRMALGAHAADVARLVFGEGFGLAAVGTVLGLCAALGLTRLLRSLLFEVRPTDPATLISVTAILLCVTGIGILIPARRATRLDAMTALRYE